jgi:uncharacterized protein (TIGR00661 family)
MARILYGVHGTGHGHAVRALTVARHFPEHEFLFVSHGDGAAILAKEFRVSECGNPETLVKRHSVDAVASFFSVLGTWLNARRNIRSLDNTIAAFKPHAAISDYECFVPLATRRHSIPCLSVDNQHILQFCAKDVTLWELPSYWITMASINLLFSNASEYIVTSFFRPDAASTSGSTPVLPPLLRENVVGSKPSDNGYIVAYQGYSTFDDFTSFLKSTGRKVRAYGLGRQGREGNVDFMPPSEEQFIEDLASCSYVICGGGHTLISEALHLGKPVLSFPIRHACEQQINALYLQRLGYGMFSTSRRPDRALVEAFEGQLDNFRKNIRATNFLGNQEIYSRINAFLQGNSRPSGSSSK